MALRGGKVDLGNLKKLEAEQKRDARSAGAFVFSRVVRVIDGDTFEVDSGDARHIRLQGVDAPETSTPEGKAAVEGLKAIMQPGDVVRLANLETQSGTTNFHERLVALVYVGDKFVNQEIVRSGWAVPTSHIFKVPSKEAYAIADALEDAKRARRGLWKKFPNSDFLKPFNLVGQIGEFPEIDELEKFSKIPGATKIGTIWLYVPPTQINITEHNANQELPLVRAPGSARLKTNQREQRVELYTIFPNRWSVNYQFRAILAQFIRSPFLPLQNGHLEDLLLPSYAISDDYTAEEPTGQTAKNRGEIKKAVENEKGLNQNVGDIPGRLAQDQGQMTTMNSKTKIRDRQLFVALRNMVVSTIPGKPEGLQVTFIMSVFNYLPHAEKVEYLRTMGDVVKQAMYFDKLATLRFPDGDPKSLDALRQGIQSTTNISKSEPFRKYYRTLLAEGNIPEVDSHLVWEKRVTPRLLPFLQERLDDVTLRLETNLLSNEKIQQNTIDLTALSEEIERRLLTELQGQSATPIGNFTNSVFTVAKLFKEFFDVFTKNGHLRHTVNNAEEIVNNRDLIPIQFGEYFNASSTETVTGIKQNLLARDDKAKDVFLAAAGRTLRDPKILELMKKVLVLEQRNRFGTKGEIKVRLRTGPKTAIAAINASYSPNVIPVAVSDHLSPSMQFFGKSDWMISINIQTCDRDLVNQLMDLSQKSRLNRMLQNDMDNWYLSKLTAIEVGILEPNSNGFFNALGINRVLVEDFVQESVQGKPGWFNMTLRLVQADLNISEYEKLIRTNFVSNKAQKQILRNIRDNGIPASSRIGKRIKDTLDNSVKQVVNGIFQGLFQNELSETQVQQLVDRGSLQKAFIENMDNPTGWSKMVKDLFMSDVVNRNDDNNTFLRFFENDGSQPNIHINPPIEGPVDISAIQADARQVSRTPLLFDERIRFSRVIFQLAINAEVNRQIAMIRTGTDDQKKELVTLYDPTSLGNVEDAVRRLSMEGEITDQSFLHGCYPDLELPIYIRNPNMISPDFFYRRDERTPTDIVDQAMTNLDKLFQVAMANMRSSTGEPSESPEGVISDIRGYLIWKKNEGAQSVSQLSSSNKLNMSAEDIAQVARGIQAPTEREVLDIIDQLEEREYSNIPVNHMIAARRLALLTEIAAIQDIVSSAPQILGKDIPREYVEILRRNQVDKVAEFNAMPQIISAGAINGLWGTLTPSNVIRNWKYLREAAKFRVNRARSEEVAGSLARAYPTAKVYFIEEDAKEWGQLDDYYNYQAVRSVQVASSKNSASKVATIQISNITRKLSDQRATLGENITRDQTDQEQVLQSFVLREGMTIMVKMGYSNDPNLLERVFMGKVVSVSQGDVIQIVAQSFGAELTGPVFNGQELKLGYLFSSARSLGDVMVQSMGSMDGLEHFGNRSMLDILKLRVPKLDQMGFEGKAYSNPKYRRWDYYKALVNPINRLVEFGVYDPRLENAYAPFTGNIQTALNSLFWVAVAPIVNANKAFNPKNAFNNLKSTFVKKDVMAVAPPNLTKVSPEALKGLVTHPTFDWYISPGATMWSMLQEMALYFNDYIVTVLPYNDNMPGMQRETIYFGPRNGLYKYTERYDEEGVTKQIFAKNKNGATEMMIDISNPDHLLDDQGRPLPGYMPVVNYHWVDSMHDIVENGIIASAEKIHNKVTIRFPGEPGKGTDNEFTVVADDNIKEGHIRHLVVDQPNIDPMAFEDAINVIIKPFLAKALRFGEDLAGVQHRIPETYGLDTAPLPSKYTVSANVLANEMRQMYDGTLKIWGRPSVKPFDVLYLNDAGNTMFGPIEVGDVIQDFNAESGFTTTIIPNAIISIRNQTKLYHDVAMNGLSLPFFSKKTEPPVTRPRPISEPVQTEMTPSNKRYVEALEAFLAGDVATAEQRARQALQLDPKNLEAKRMVERIEQKRGVLRAPVATKENRELGQELYRRGLEAFLAGDMNEAQKQWAAAERADPNNLEAVRGQERIAQKRNVVAQPIQTASLVQPNQDLSPGVSRLLSPGEATTLASAALVAGAEAAKVATNLASKFPKQTAALSRAATWSARMTAGAIAANPGTAAAIGVGLAALGIYGAGFLWSKGLAKVMGRDIITVTGLFYNGVPFVAGLEGAYKDSYRVHFEDWVTNLVTFSASQETFGQPLELR